MARSEPRRHARRGVRPGAHRRCPRHRLAAQWQDLRRRRLRRPDSIGGQTRNHIARLDAATGLADSFDPNANGLSTPSSVQPDGKILAGGEFACQQHRRSGAQSHRAAQFALGDGGFCSIRTRRQCPLNRHAAGRQSSGRRRLHSASVGNRVPGSRDSTRTTGLARFVCAERQRTCHVQSPCQADGKVLAGGSFTDYRRAAAQSNRPTRCRRPAWPIRLTRTRTTIVQINRGAIGRENSGRRPDSRTSADSRATTSPGSIVADGLADSFDPNANGNVLLDRRAVGR